MAVNEGKVRPSFTYFMYVKKVTTLGNYMKWNSQPLHLTLIFLRGIRVMPVLGILNLGAIKIWP
jgi:hypothetical protein